MFVEMLQLRHIYILTLLTLALAWASAPALAQSKWSKSVSSSEQVDSLAIYKQWLESAESLFTSNKAQAYELVQDALIGAISNQYQEAEAEGYLLLGKFYIEDDQPDMGLEYLNDAIEIFETNQNSSGNYRAKKVKAKGVKGQNKLEEATRLYNELLAQEKAAADTAAVLKTGAELTDLYIEQNAYNDAVQVAGACLDLADSRDDVEEKIKANISLGEAKMSSGTDGGGSYGTDNFKQAILLSDSIDNEALKYEAVDGLARNQLTYGWTVEAIDTRQEFNSVRGRELSPEIELDNKYQQAETYFANGNTEDAQQILLEVSKNPYLSNFSVLRGKVYKKLVDIYTNANELQLAKASLEEYLGAVGEFDQKQKQDFTAKLNTINTINANVTRVKLLEKDKEIKASKIVLLQKEKNLQESSIWMRNIVIAALLLLTLAMLFVLRAKRKAHAKEKLAGQVVSLQSMSTQMNPHFIFNALNSVNHFIASQNERIANQYLADFSGLMRKVLGFSDQQLISLEDEIELLEVYLKLEHQRFADKFDFNFDVAPSILEQDIQLPPMFIQPFIENAIWHGLRYKEDKGKLSVKIEDGSQMLVTITDDGIGREKSKTLKTQDQKRRKEKGISNTQKRMDLINSIYNANVQVEIVDLENPVGTKIKIYIPKDLKTKEWHA